MTEYNLFPPILFRFEGDESRARTYVPQARTLMQQLVRRMEAGDVEALIWNVKAQNGIEYEIKKLGDQHLVRILAPVVSSDDISRRGYLWVGVRIILPNVDEELMAVSYRKQGNITTRTARGSSFAPKPPGYESVPYWPRVVSIDDAVDMVPMIETPDAVLNLFQPIGTENSPEQTGLPESGIIYSAMTDEYETRGASDYYGYVFHPTATGETYSDSNIEEGQGYIALTSQKNVINFLYANSSLGSYSTSPYMYRKDGPIDVHSYIVIDSNDPEKSTSDMYLPPSASGSENEVNTSYDLSYQYEVYNDDVNGLLNSGQRTITNTSTGITTTYDWIEVYHDETISYSIKEAEITEVSENESFACRGKALDGFYGLEVGAAMRDTLQGKENLAGMPVEYQVYIQVGNTLNTYNVNATVDSNGNAIYPGYWMIDVNNGTVLHKTDEKGYPAAWQSTYRNEDGTLKS